MKTRRLLGVLVVRDVDGDEAVHLAHLHGGQADAGRRVHGFEHVFGKLANAIIDADDGRRSQSKLRGGKDNEGAC